MKKKILVLAISAVVANVAMAQSKSSASSQSATPNSAKVVSVVPIAPAPIPSITPALALDVPKLEMEQLADNPLVNPFSGKLVSDEEMQRELERKRRQTQMAEELLKQTNVANELHAATMRKNVEIAQSVTALQKEHNSQIDLRSVLETRESERLRITANYENELRRQAEEKRKAAEAEKERKRQLAEAERNKLSPTAMAEKRRAEAAAIKAAAQLKESQAQAAAQQKPRILPSLVSVMDVSGKKTAVISVDRNTYKVSDGDNTPYGKVRIHSNSEVSFDGRRVSLQGKDGVTRFVSSDVAKVEGAPAGGGANFSQGSYAMAPAPQAMAPHTPIELTSAPSAEPVKAEQSGPTLPRLQLPPPTLKR